MSAADDPSPLVAGACLGRFTIVRLIGAGGMGSVYEALDPELDRPVAIKVLRGEHAGVGSLRLAREAKALAQLSHPNVVSVYDVGEAGESLFIAMEYVDGLTLDQHLHGRRPSWRAALGLLAQAGRGLAAAHARSLVHRDVKPSNILVDREGRVRVSDFGLVRMASDAPEQDGAAPPEAGIDVEGATVERSPRPSPLLDANLTGSDALVGTPRYMSPEQRARRPATARSDQYSFCRVLWEVLHGELPPARRRRVPRWLTRALERGLLADPAARHASMTELLRVLERTPVRRARVAWGAGALLLAGGAASAALLARPGGVDCGRAGAEIAAAWTEPTRAAVATAYARARPDAPDGARAVLARVDGYVASWRAASVDVCRATHERGEQSAAMQDRRAACLAEGPPALRALVMALARVDAAGADRALEAVAGLPRADRCTATAVADAAAASPDPRELLASKVALRLGHVAESLTYAEAALAAARAGGDARVLARAQLQHGRVVADLDSNRGRAELEEALPAAARSGDRELAAEAAVELVRILVYEGVVERVEGLLPGAQAAVASARDPAHAHDLAAHEARYLVHAGKPAAALAAACDRVAALERAGLAPLAAGCRCTAAIFLRDVPGGKHWCREHLDTTTARYGPDHPEVAAALVALANILDTAGDFKAARALLERAAPIYARAYGDGARSATLAITLGNVTSNDQDYAAARGHYERAVDIIRRTTAGPSRPLASALVGLAGTCALTGDAEGAERHGDEALRVAEAVLGTENARLVPYYFNQGQALHDVGRPAAALPIFRKAVALAEKTSPGEMPHGMSLLGAAQCLNEVGRPREALPLAERGLAMIAPLDTAPDNLALGRMVLGEALLGAGARERGRRELRGVRAALEQMGPAGKKDLARVDALLAR